MDESPNRPQGRQRPFSSRVRRFVPAQIVALFVSGFGPAFTSAALAAAAYCSGLLAGNSFLAGAAAGMAGLAVALALINLARREMWPKLRAIKEGVARWIDEGEDPLQRRVEEQQEAIRSALAAERRLKEELEDKARLEEKLGSAKKKITALKKDRRRLRQEFEEEIGRLASLAELGEFHLLYSDILVGWLTYLSSWPEGISPARRTSEFLSEHFRAGLARVFPDLGRCGIALVADEDGTYELMYEELAPPVVRALGSLPVGQGLKMRLNELGVADAVVTELPDLRRKDHAEWLVVFARVEPDPTFDLLVTSGTKILSQIRGS